MSLSLTCWNLLCHLKHLKFGRYLSSKPDYNIYSGDILTMYTQKHPSQKHRGLDINRNP